MAKLADRLTQNAAGNFFVDRTCIDCETCRQIAPQTFRRDRRVAQSVVAAQPRTATEERRALMALVACPTASIGTLVKGDVRGAARSFPEEITPGVYSCGYAAAASYGASSYLITRPEGNVLIDSPRAARPLMERLRALGGVRLMFLTHRDDVADHREFRRVFGCDRILHADDVDAGTADVEIQLRGDRPVVLASDLLAIPVPGHTRGSAALLYGDRFLFTGDHLWADEDSGRLEMGRAVCWHSWPRQVASLRRLLEHQFEWVLPGHGRRFHAATAAEMATAVRDLLHAAEA